MLSVGHALAADVTWSGSWHRTEPVDGRGGLTLVVKSDGGGTIKLAGSLCLATETPATVATQGSNMRVEIKTEKTNALFAGTVSGGSVSGTMTVSCGGQTGKGTWEAKAP